jgi:hypothetical protein
VEMAIEQPAWGQVRVSEALKRRGLSISPAGVRRVWQRHSQQRRQVKYQLIHFRSKDPRAPTRGGPFLRSPASRSELERTELILGLSARLPMPRGRQLGIARWCHAVHTLQPS